MELVAKIIVIEDSPATLRGRIVDADGNVVVAADVQTVVVTSFDKATASQVGPTETFLGVDVIAEPDANGFNLALPLDGSQWPQGDTTYRIQAYVTPDDGTPFFCLWDAECVGVYGQ